MKLLLAFDDISQGGTSRSALLFARLWKNAGAEVLIYTPRGLHAGRASSAFAEGLTTTSDLREVKQFEPLMAHVHHAAPSRDTQTWTGALAAVLPADTVILTHNVFAQHPGVNFGSHTVVGVLGDWAAAQYSWQNPTRTEGLRVVPNPQDFATFRPPTAQERADARQELGVTELDRVILRVGSPNEAKWCKSGYEALVRVAGTKPNTKVRLIGAPPSYLSLAGHRVHIESKPVDDYSLLREYRAADVFAHWAERGESFGNVILEALGSGLPVVYRAVKTRDNTPAEFRMAPTFTYTSNTRSWLNSAMNVSRTGEALPRTFQTMYDSVNMQQRLQTLVTKQREGPVNLHDAVLAAFAPSKPLGVVSSTAVALRHNIVTAAVKRRRLERQG